MTITLKKQAEHLYNYAESGHWVAWCGALVDHGTACADKARLIEMRVPRLAARTNKLCKECVRRWEEA